MTLFHLMKRVLKRFQMLFLGAAVTIAIALILILFLRDHINAFSNYLVRDDVSRVEQGLTTDTQYAYAEIMRMSEEPEIVNDIEERDLFKLLPALADAEKNREINFSIAVDKKGIVLARTQDYSRLGEYIFETTSWGNVVSQGGGVVSIEREGLGTLSLIAGYPVGPESSPVGALFGGYSIDDNYAKRIKEKYAKDKDEEVAFYSTEDGVVGSSFVDAKTKTLLSTYFNTGSDWIQSGRSDREVIMQGKRYFVKNIPLKGLERSEGGVLIFSPINVGIENLILGLLAVIVFLIGMLILSEKDQRMTHRFVLVLLLASIIVLLGVTSLGKLVHDVYPIQIEKTPYKIYNSTLSLEPSSGILSKEFEQHIAIKVSSGGEAINAAQVVLTYDPRIMRVVDLITTNSFCDAGMFLETKIDNVHGEVHITCTLPSPGFSKNNGILAELTIQPLLEGSMTLDFAKETEILANDGLGTNVLRSAMGGSYRIGESDSDTKVVSQVLPFSPTHPNSARWYNRKDLRFIWQRQPGTTYRYSLDHNATSTALTLATTSGSVSFPNTEEGIYYFHIAKEEGNKLGKITTSKVSIDTTPPQTPIIKASATRVAGGDVVRLAFESSDQGSGLQRNYYVRFDNGVFLPVASTLSIVFPIGTHTVTLRAFDQAGNYSDGTITIEAVNPVSMGAVLWGAMGREDPIVSQ